jgi:hypothetical protein
MRGWYLRDWLYKGWEWVELAMDRSWIAECKGGNEESDCWKRDICSLVEESLAVTTNPSAVELITPLVL